MVGLVLVVGCGRRVALGHDLAPASSGQTVGPARHGVLLMNPWSGGGKVERFDLEAEAAGRGVTPIVLRRGDDLRALAELAVAAGADVIGMAGGDGSQALVADVARQHDVALVCVPAGTRNHFALDLGLDRADVVAALDAYGDAVERQIDLARIGDRVFVNNASLGVYATVVQSEAYRDAKLATTAQMLPDLLGPGGTVRPALRRARRAARPSRGHAPGLQRRLPAGVLNGFGTRDGSTTGVLGIVTVTVDRARDLPVLIAAEAAGTRSLPRLPAWTTPEFVVDSAEALIDVGVDGEAFRLPPPLRFRSLPGALRVRTPLMRRAPHLPRRHLPASARRCRRCCACSRVGRRVGTPRPDRARDRPRSQRRREHRACGGRGRCLAPDRGSPGRRRPRSGRVVPTMAGACPPGPDRRRDHVGGGSPAGRGDRLRHDAAGLGGILAVLLCWLILRIWLK